jgi:hypothetical protein
MIRKPESAESLTISVKLKDGREFENRDITDNPFGDNERVVSFWENDDTVLIFPMSEVAEYRLHFS